MFQQQAESEGVQPNHNNNMPNSISEEPINRLPSNLGGNANQSQLFYMPNSSSEEPIHQLPSNLGGSAHQSDPRHDLSDIEDEDEEEAASFSPYSQPNSSSKESQLSQPQSADGLNHYRPLYDAAQSGDWQAAIRFIEHDSNALTAKITALTGKTVLHVAACCWQWEFVLKLLEHITSPQSIAVSPQSIAVQTKGGKTVMHYVAQGGSLKTAKALVQMNSDLLQIKDKDDYLPLFDSILSGNKKLVWYLSLKTTYESSSDSSFSKILRYLIILGYHDIALYFVQRYPNLAIDKDKDGGSLLYWLARNPSSFFSGSNLGFLEKRIYEFVHVDIRNSQSHYFNTEDFLESILKGSTTLEPRSFATQVLRWFKGLFWKTIAQLVAYVEKVRDAKLKHEYAVELVNHVCPKLSSMSFQEMKDFLRKPKDIMTSAVKDGIEEIVRALFQNFPDLIYVQLYSDHRYYKQTILQTAIEYRQVKIVNIIKEILPSLQLATTNRKRKTRYSAYESTTLQLAGGLARPFKLHSVSGAAFQMQRELQWFKEVKENEFPILWDFNNADGETPEEVFRRAHEDLAKEGEKWMKDTANSCMVVSALIATVLFAAAFTVPGGNTNDDKGIPIFLRTNAFTIFAIFDALGLFSSLTSLITFLSIITERYEVEDFLESLPKKLIVGLGSLFFAIVAMITAFGAALTIVLNERWNWVYVPITFVAFLPVLMFVWLQLLLFVQMVQSTCGASIFRPSPSRKFE